MRARHPSVLAALCLAVPLVGGCAPLGLQPDMAREGAAPRANESPRSGPAGMRLAEAAERAEAALTALAMMRAAEMPPSPAGMPAEAPGSSPVSGSSPVPAELRWAVTIDWIGPVETLAEALARRAGYGFAVGGAAPARPVMVSVTARNLPLIEVLQDTGLQAGDAATLTVDAGRRTVRLDWTGELPGSGIRRDGAAGSGS